MRIGSSPEKTNNDLNDYFKHRIIIPVFIPEINGYYRDSLRILEISLKSLLASIDNKSVVTVVNNRSAEPVTNYLNHVLINNNNFEVMHLTENIGKIDAIMRVVRGTYEPFITISDCDVLFKSNWMSEVFAVFKNIPEAGMVSPVPLPKHIFVDNSSTIIGGLLRRSLNFKRICDVYGMERFATSVGDKNYFKDIHYKYQLVTSRNGFDAIIGAGHFVATLRREVFKFSPQNRSMKKIVGGSEREYIDIPNDQSGYWRLATVKNLAFHLGNTYEEWMENEVNANVRTNNMEIYYPLTSKHIHLNYQLRKLLIKVIKKYRNIFFYGELTKRELKDY